MNSNPPIRPTKKQRELLTFITNFINVHGYSPSYREIMNGLNYTSVATVAVHVNNLIARGQLRKRDHSARSLELVQDQPAYNKDILTNEIKPNQEKWLIDKVEFLFRNLEQANVQDKSDINNLEILIAALRVLGMEAAAQSFVPRLKQLKDNS